MIARVWRGVTRLADAAEYAEYVQRTGIDAYLRTPGNQGAWLLWRPDGDRAEFVTMSLWDSRQAIEAFAGEDIDQAVYYPEDDRYLIERDPRVTHYEASGATRPSAPAPAPSAPAPAPAQVTRIGRGPANDIVVSELGVSKQHAELRRSPSGRYSITDLDSHNGTYVNGTRITDQELAEGDIIKIGQATLRLSGRQLVEHAEDTPPPP